MKYETFSRRVNWSETRLDGNWLVYDQQIKYWFAIIVYNKTELQGIGRTPIQAYSNLCKEAYKLSIEPEALDKFRILDKMYEEKTCQVPIW